MALAPFWSAITVTCDQQLSNAEVENHFRDMKGKMQAGQRLTLASFVSSRYNSMKQKLARVVR